MLAEIFGLDAVVVIVVVFAVLFGGSQIPKLARSLGSARREFQHGASEGASGPGDSPPGSTASPALRRAGDPDGAPR
jgi:sec-independent protein translocase protein TatA